MTPDRDTFVRLAADHDVVPVRVTLLGDTETPVSVFAALAGDDGPGFLLESVEGGDRWARWSFVGWDPLFTVVSDGEGTRVLGDGPEVTARDPLSALEEIVGTLKVAHDPDLPPLHSGLVGYLGFDAVRHVEHLPHQPEDDRGLPLMVWHAVGALAAVDRFSQTVTLLRNVVPADDPAAAYDAAVAALEADAAALSAAVRAEPRQVPAFDRVPESTASMTADEYAAAVDRAVEYVVAGDAFQIVPSIRFEVALETDAFAVYRALRLINPSPYMFFIRHEDMAIAGSSPELMVRVRDGRVHSRPIAGTRPRGATSDEDAALETELLADPKERAEHVMLVDLARNDLGRVAEFGTVQVDDLMVIERYSHVMHIVSGVSADLRDGVGPVDVIRATFPHGTVSGAPKVRAIEIIDELEPVARGPYAGAVGYVDFSGNVDTAIALRTMVSQGSTAWVQAGAGVVADSDPMAEYRECVAKARAVLAAIGGASDV
jgi:anthranilate synthase component 1